MTMALKDVIDGACSEVASWPDYMRNGDGVSTCSDAAIFGAIDLLTKRLDKLQAEAFRRGLVRK